MTTSTKAAPKTVAPAKITAALKFHTAALVSIGKATEPNLIEWIRAIALDMNSGLLSVAHARAVVKAARDEVEGFNQLRESHAQYFPLMAAISQTADAPATIAALYYSADQLTRAQKAGKGETKTAKAAAVVAAALSKGANLAPAVTKATKANSAATKKRAARPASGGKVESTGGVTVDMVNALRVMIERLRAENIGEDMGAALNELACVISEKIDN